MEMSEKALDMLNGQISAISHTLNAVISVLPGPLAEAAALQLQQAVEDQRLEDHQDGTPEALSEMRDRITRSYVQLLQTVAKRG